MIVLHGVWFREILSVFQALRARALQLLFILLLSLPGLGWGHRTMRIRRGLVSGRPPVLQCLELSLPGQGPEEGFSSPRPQREASLTASTQETGGRRLGIQMRKFT